MQSNSSPAFSWHSWTEGTASCLHCIPSHLKVCLAPKAFLCQSHPAELSRPPPPAFHTHSDLRASSSMNGLPPRYPTFPPKVQGPEWLWSREHSRSTVDTGQSFILCIPTLLERQPVQSDRAGPEFGRENVQNFKK